jgi:hypothetical protein
LRQSVTADQNFSIPIPLAKSTNAASGMNKNKLTKVKVIPSVKCRPGITSFFPNIFYLSNFKYARKAA